MSIQLYPVVHLYKGNNGSIAIFCGPVRIKTNW
jgi:hypothetical protein